MKNLITIVALLLVSIASFCQKGVNFEKLTLNEALTKAKVENKLVFMDCYTAWCGPCRHMAEKIFPQEKAGEYFNPKFISVKYDMEKGEGKTIAKKFGVESFPTFFILRPDGSTRHKIVGANDLEEFIARIEKGLSKNTALGDLERLYEAGKISKNELIAYQAALIDASEKKKVKKIEEELDAILTNKDRKKREYWPVLREKPYGSVDFNYVLSNMPVFYAKIGKKEVDNYLHSAFSQAIKKTLHHKAKNPIEALIKMRDELIDIPLENKEHLILSINLNQACLEKNVDKAVAFAQTYTSDKQGDIWQILSAFNKIRPTASKEDLKKIITLEDQFIRIFKGSRGYVGNYFQDLKTTAHTGIYFQDLSYKNALEKARLLGKKLFIACYTTKCEAYQKMAETVFKEEKAGDILNTYLCVKLDMEKEDGPEVTKIYNINEFPTFIILHSDGTLDHKFVGNSDAETFIKKVQDNQE